MNSPKKSIRAQEMSSPKWQDTELIYRNKLYFSTLAMKCLKMELRKQFIYDSIEKNNT